MSETVINPTLPESIQVDPNTGTVIIPGFSAQQNLNNNNGNDMINLGSPNDVATGSGSNNTFFTEGNDFFVGTQGDDYIQGQGGNDTIQGQGGNDLLDGQRNNDVLQGVDGNDTIRGGKDNDFLDGGLDNDSLLGDRLNDTVIGGEGNDILFGGKENDILDGGAGNDILEGGEGADIYRFQWFGDDDFAPDALTQPFGLDTLRGFNPQEDTIYLDEDVFDDLDTPENSNILAVNDFTTIANFNPNNPISAGQADLVYDSAQGLLYYIDETASVPIMQMEPGLNLTNNDFVIIE